MFYSDLYPSQEVQESILKQLTDEHVQEFFDKHLVQWFKDSYYDTSNLKCEEIKFLKEVKNNVTFIHMYFTLIDDYSEMFDEQLAFSLFNVFSCHGIRGDIMRVIDDGLTKKWMKFLKEKIPDYAPVLEEYRAKLTERVKENNEKRIKSAEQANKDSLEELNILFTD